MSHSFLSARTLSLVMVCWLAAFAALAEPAAPGRAVAELAKEANRAFGLARSEVVRLDPGQDNRGRVSVPVQINGAADELVLLPWSARSPRHRVLAQVADGSYVEVPAGPVQTYRGELKHTPGSVVAATLLESGFEARVLLPNGKELWLEPLAGRIPGAQAGQHLLYRGEDVLPGNGVCLALAVAGAADGDSTTTADATTAAAASLQRAELATDADYEYFLRWGSVSGVQTRIESVINAMNIQYERDVAITHLLGTMIVRTAEPDPYSSTDAVTLLNQFRDQWNLNHRTVARDTAHLFTGKVIDGSTIGIAWVGVICQPTSGSGYGYGLSQSDFNNSFASATDLTAHELGHNWNAGHCSCPSHTMNAYITSANQFNPVGTIPTISTFRDSRTCLDTVTSEPPAAPTGLTASVASASSIALAWADNAGNEQGYDVERAVNGGTWSLRVSLGANAASYTDTGLAANTTYAYRVRAYNDVGASAYSNVASATTPEPPPYVDQVATGELRVSGTVSGSYTATWQQDGVTQRLTEQESGGQPARRTSLLEYVWLFDVQAGQSVAVFVNAWGGASGDSFRFEVSTNGGASYQPMFIVGQTATTQFHQHALPATTAGSVRVRVVDTDRTAGNRQLDSVWVDQIFIRSDFGGAPPPPDEPPPDEPPPTGITLQSASGYKVKGAQAVDLGWSGGGSTVVIRRNNATVATVANTGSYTDNIGAKGGGSYTYQVCEPGPTDCSNTQNVVF